MLYLWEMSECSQKFIAEYDRELSPDRFLFLDGVPLTNEQVNKKIIFDVEVTKAQISKYDCIHNNSASQLVNQKVIDILLKLAPEEVQFFDAEVRCKDGILMGYKLLNLTRKFIDITDIASHSYFPVQ